VGKGAELLKQQQKRSRGSVQKVTWGAKHAQNTFAVEKTIREKGYDDKTETGQKAISRVT